MNQLSVSPVQKLGNAEAIRYGDAQGLWYEGAAVRIANFVLGHDVNSTTTVLNEHMLDVVKPIDEFWKPEDGFADLEITNQRTGTRLSIGLGQWLARYPTGLLRVLSTNPIAENAAPLLSMTFQQELTRVIDKHKKADKSGTPPHILARMLSRQLEMFNDVIIARQHMAD